MSDNNSEDVDFVIVGAGTAGCVLANRLSADSKNTVAVLEAGGEARHPAIHIPLMAGFVYFLRSINWSYETEPEPQHFGWLSHGCRRSVYQARSESLLGDLHSGLQP